MASLISPVLPPSDHIADGPGPMQMFLLHRPWLIGLLSRRYGREAAADIVQDAFRQLAGTGAQTKVHHPQAFLLRVALNLASKRARAARRRPTEALDDVAEPAQAPSQMEAVLLRQIVLALSPKLRDVFILNHIRGLTYQEIATLLGISVKTVEKRMSQALAQCRAAMRD